MVLPLLAVVVNSGAESPTFAAAINSGTANSMRMTRKRYKVERFIAVLPPSRATAKAASPAKRDWPLQNLKLRRRHVARRRGGSPARPLCSPDRLRAPTRLSIARSALEADRIFAA